MHISYKKLWKLLIDRDLKKKDLCELAGISSASMAKLGKNEKSGTIVDYLERCDDNWKEHINTVRRRSR